MEVHGKQVFWFICLGLLVGGCAKLFFGDKGRSTIANVVGAALWAVFVGVLGTSFGMFGSITFATMGTTGFVVLFNVFSLVNDQDENLQRQ